MGKCAFMVAPEVSHPCRRPLLLGPPGVAKMYQETCLKKGTEKQGTWSPQGTPKMEPTSQDFRKKINFGVVRDWCRNEVQKKYPSGRPWMSKMMLPPTRELSFHFLQGQQKDSQNGPKMELTWARNPTKDSPRSLQERSQKIL